MDLKFEGVCFDAYYYCDRCGHFEYIDSCYFGIDAKEKFCPECGLKMRAEGFSLDEECVWGTEENPKKIYFEYSAPHEFRTFAMRKLKEVFYESEVLKATLYDNSDVNILGGLHENGFVILPAKKKKEDYPEQRVFLSDGTMAFYAPLNMVKELGAFWVMFYEGSIAEHLYRLQQRMGIYLSEIRQDAISGYSWRDITNTGIMSDEERKKEKNLQPKDLRPIMRWQRRYVKLAY